VLPVSDTEPSAEVELDHDGTPLEPWQRPPFRPGHTLSMRHGAYSPRRYEPLAAEMIDQVLEHAAQPGSSTAYLSEPSYRPALWSWAKTEAQLQLIEEWLAEHGDQAGGFIDGEGEMRGPANYWLRLSASAAKQRESLGMTPLSRARLGRDVASSQVDLARLAAELYEEDEQGG
jgi:hypothetical protein